MSRRLYHARSRVRFSANFACARSLRAGGKLLSRDQTHTAGWDYDSPAMASISIYALACQDIQFGNTGPVTAQTCP